MAHLHRRAESASIDSLSSWYTILYIICYILTNHCQVEKILFYGWVFGLFGQVADTWPLRPAGNHSNPCGTQTYEASSNFDECKQPAGRKNLSSLLHKRRENGSTRFKIEFQIPPRRHSISPNRRALHSKGGI